MAERETLLSTLPEEVRPDAERLYAENPDPNPHDIVAQLHHRGLLRDEQLRDAVLALEASLHVGRMQRRPPEKKLPTILGPLGAGAMGEVLIAKDEGLNRIVAVKRLLPELASRAPILERFYKEAQITAQLDHPSIVPIHGLVEPGDGSLAYTMKLVRGRTLDAYLDEARDQWRKTGGESGAHVLSARLERFLHVCDAIAYAHDRGVVHRDLKPENVMVGAFGEVLVMDWGIAKVLEQAEEPVADGEALPPRKAHGTRVGTVFGTPRYMSPEQAEGKNDVIDARSDQYALGLCLLEVVTLRPAIDPQLELDQCLEWARAGRKQAMVHVHRKGTVPRELEAIVGRATVKDPARRYPSVTALSDDLRRYLRDEAVLARPDTLVQRVQRWIGHHRGLVATLILGLMLLVVMVTSTMGAGALGVLEWRRRVAAGREEALTGLLGQATTGANTVERAVRFAEYQLVGLSFAAEAALVRAEGTVQLNYDPLEGEPPKGRESAVYGRKVSVERPSFAARTIPDQEMEKEIDEIAAISLSLTRVLVDSGGEDVLNRRQRRERIAKEGVPIRWARLGTRSGVVAVMPGTEPFRDGVDPTTLVWYRNDDREGIVWTPPRVDPDGTGIVLTASRPFYDTRQAKLGTAAIDLTLDALAELLVPPEGARDVFLVDPAAEMVAWRGMHAADQERIEPRPLPVPELSQPLQLHPEGWLEVGDSVAVWETIPALGWRYVLIVDDDALDAW